MSKPIRKRWHLEVVAIDFTEPTIFKIIDEGEPCGTFSVKKQDEYLIQYGEKEPITFRNPVKAFDAIDDFVNDGEWHGE